MTLKVTCQFWKYSEVTGGKLRRVRSMRQNSCFHCCLKPVLTYRRRNLFNVFSGAASLRTPRPFDTKRVFLKRRHHSKACVPNIPNILRTKIDIHSLSYKFHFFQSPVTKCIRLQNTTPWQPPVLEQITFRKGNTETLS
ncbi:hypothetical protein TNCV_2669451 [Trichonephila clavipes]|nr:hypothetical protein TNCV_2669451 [Trichonephila clavipes]